MDFSGLRPKQVRAVEMLRSTWKRHDTHVINAPCGYGKTALASYLCKSFADRGQKVIFAAPYITLVNQTYERFEQYGHRDLSVIWRDDARYDPRCLIQIASADTLIRRDMPEDTAVLIVDEAHLKRMKLLEAMREKKFKTIGLTATPFPKWMGVEYEGFIKPCTTQELIEEELLTPFEIHRPSAPDTSGIKRKKNEYGEMDYDQEDVGKVMGDAKIAGDIVKYWLENGDNLPTIGFAPNVETANAYTILFQRSGVSAEVVTANTPMMEREQTYYRFREGRCKIIWNVGVLGAGFDADVRCIIWARMTKSEIVWMQGTMRGSRPALGKHKCLLFDHAGTYLTLGDPTQIEYYELHDGTEATESKRQKAREKREKEAAKPKPCGGCGRMKDPGEYVCKKCGHKPLAGEITVEVDESIAMEIVTGQKKKGMTQDQKIDFYQQLLGWQVQRAHEGKPVSSGRIAHIYKDKTGVWPRSMPEVPKPPGPDVVQYIKYQNIKFAKSRKRA